uniref:Uncharacterized protein n=1 Tax=Arundo donax TaxID=35708 RepID=A0A0A9ENS9_ARUDO
MSAITRKINMPWLNPLKERLPNTSLITPQVSGLNLYM